MHPLCADLLCAASSVEPVDIRTVDGSVTSDLRRRVLRPSWPAGSAMHGDREPGAVHVAAFDDDGVVVGTCLVLPAPFPYGPGPGQWQLRGMATADGLRGRGIGGDVLAGAVAEISARGGTLVWCGARTTAVPFYERHGFAAVGAEYTQEETGLPHFTMWRAVEPAATPTTS